MDTDNANAGVDAGVQQHVPLPAGCVSVALSCGAWHADSVSDRFPLLSLTAYTHTTCTLRLVVLFDAAGSGQVIVGGHWRHARLGRYQRYHVSRPVISQQGHRSGLLSCVCWLPVLRQ